MVSLTTASITARKGVRYSIYGIILIIIARIAITNGTEIIQSFLPEEVPTPTVKFGTLPELPFPEKSETEQQEIDGFTYRLETPTNSLPEVPTLLEVYFMPGPQSNIRALDKAKEIAQTLKFNSDAREIVETVYAFTRNETTLNINIVTSSFSISSVLTTNPKLANQISPPAEATINNVRSLLSSAGLLRDITGPVDHTFMRIEEGELVEAASQSLGNVILLNFNRELFGEDEIPAVTPDPKRTNVWFVAAGGNNDSNILQGEYKYYPIDEETFSTYPLKTSSQAWEDLNQGEAYIADIGNNIAGNEIPIRNAYLAYYDPGKYAEFYQPVIVFEGDGGFVAYVAAVTDQYYGQDS